MPPAAIHCRSGGRPGLTKPQRGSKTIPRTSWRARHALCWLGAWELASTLPWPRAGAAGAKEDELKAQSKPQDRASEPERDDADDEGEVSEQQQAPGPRAKTATKAERLGNLFMIAAAAVLALAVGVRWAMGRSAPAAAAPTAAPAPKPPAPSPLKPTMVRPPRPERVAGGQEPAVAPPPAVVPAPPPATVLPTARPAAPRPAPPKTGDGKKPAPYVPSDI